MDELNRFSYCECANIFRTGTAAGDRSTQKHNTQYQQHHDHTPIKNRTCHHLDHLRLNSWYHHRHRHRHHHHHHHCLYLVRNIFLIFACCARPTSATFFFLE